MIYNKMNKPAKIVIFSTFDKPATLSYISKVWFNNKTRYYTGNYTNRVNCGVNYGFIRRNGRYYKANSERILSEAINNLSFKLENKKLEKYLNNYRNKLKFFYIQLGKYTLPTYLNLDIIKILCRNDPNIASQLDIATIIQLPFFLRFIEDRDKAILKLFTSMWNLNEYYYKIVDYEHKNLHLLNKDQIYDLGETYEFVIPHLSLLFKNDSSALSKSLESMKIFGGGKFERG